MVIGLASVIIGTSLFKKLTFVKTTTAVIIGSILYKGCVAIAIRFFDPQSMKLITAVLFLVILVISMEENRKPKAWQPVRKEEKCLNFNIIHKYYNPGTVNEMCLFEDFNLSIKKGQFVSVVGSNGSGKTSMLNIVCGSINPDSGKILIEGQDITKEKNTAVCAESDAYTRTRRWEPVRI